MISIIVPTYNERRNLVELVKRLDTSFKKNNLQYEIILVDDNSPDRTYELARELSKKYPLKAIKRVNERGLASAVVLGFQESKYGLLAVIDADLQHPPEKMIELIFALRQEDIDLVIGSRLIKSGKVEEWPFQRRLTSWVARLLAAPLTKVKDSQSGFFALKKEVIENIPFNPLGYKILLEILVKGKYAGIKEVPYTFMNRTHGTSKLTTKLYIQYLLHLLRLYTYKFKKLL